MVSETEVYAALQDVIHPTFGMSLINLGMVRAVRVTANGIEVDLTMNCPGCPAGEAVLARLREKLHILDVGGGVKLMILPEVWQPPWGTGC